MVHAPDTTQIAARRKVFIFLLLLRNSLKVVNFFLACRFGMAYHC